MMLNGRTVLYVALGCGLVFVPALGFGPNSPQIRQHKLNRQRDRIRMSDPLNRPRSDKERFEAQKAVRQELKGAYKTWLDQDVAYIITDEERKAFKNLSNDEEREAFIEQFLAAPQPQSRLAR